MSSVGRTAAKTAGRARPVTGVTPDGLFALAFARIHQSIVHGDVTQALDELSRLKERVSDAFCEIEEQALAVADANARAAELVSQLTDELEAQNRELRRQNVSIEQARRELELQSRAAAEANVDAVLEVEAAQQRLSELEREQAELEATRLELARKAMEMEEEATALASANVDAVTMMVESEKTLDRLARTVSEARVEKERLQEKVFIDELTGLFNHRYFREQMKTEHARARRYRHPLSLVFLDLDHFKRVNDTYGHLAGDRVLKKVAELVQSQLRTSDIPVRVGSEPVPARYGGEELVVILPETDLDGAVAMAERIRAAAEAQLWKAVGAEDCTMLTLSAGVSCLTPDDVVPSDLVRRADEALYRAKAGGRNRVETA
jgi:diguanylate cyclase (GGDEF)-like protein